MYTLGLVLMSIGILRYGVVPMFADFNRTHTTNPRWSKHARFHVVSQLLTTSAIAVAALWLLWSPNVERDIGACIAAVLSFAVIGGFFVSAGLRNFYDGALSDAHSERPTPRRIDLNVVNFGAAAVLIAIGRVARL